MPICGLYIQEDLKFTIRKFDFDIWDIDTSFIELIRKLDISIKAIKFHYKIFETVFTRSSGEENMINVSKPYRKLKLLSL